MPSSLALQAVAEEAFLAQDDQRLNPFLWQWQVVGAPLPVAAVADTVAAAVADAVAAVVVVVVVAVAALV